MNLQPESSLEKPALPVIETAALLPEVYAFPASPQQQQLWFLDQLEPGNPAYNIPLAYELRGGLSVTALEAAFSWMLNRHETFRTRFVMQGDQGDHLLQIVDPERSIRLQQVDLRSLPDAQREATSRKLVADEAATHFDLVRGPLARGLLIRLEARRQVLVLNFHHATLDHLSVLQFAREFCAAYAAFARGAAPALESPALQYPDFSVWQEEQMREPGFQEDLRQWVARLADAPAALDLPLDRPRPSAQSFVGQEVKFSLPAPLSERIRELARSSRKSVYVTLLTAFKCLLARYSGQADVVIGSPFSNRTVGDLEGVMGCCMNTLPLYSQLGDAHSFRDALKKVYQTVLEAYARQRVPLKVIVDALRPQRDPRMNPLFQATLVMQDPPMTLQLPDLEIIPLEVHNHTSKFDFTVWLWDAQGQISGLWEYNTELFDQGSVERMIRNFETFLSAVVSHPDTAWRELPLLSTAERRLLLEEWNRTARDYPAELCLHELVGKQVERTPEAVAVVFGDTRLSYRELWERTGKVAAALRARGVGPGSLVGVFLERSAEMVVAVLGVLGSGAAYVPMDPLFPRERLGWMIEDAAMPVILTQSSLVEALPPHQAALICLDQPLPETPTSNLQPSTSRPDDLAYVIFTSGSTGRPKGVELPHRAVVNFLCAMRREPGLAPHDVLLAVTTLSFDIAGLELFLPLITGATVAIASRETAADGVALLAELERVGATVLQATPVTWRLLLAAGWKSSPSLTALVGGEAVPRELVNQLVPRCREVWNMYGPTETTIWSTSGRLAAGEGTVSIGRPIANTQIFIVNESLQLQPVGVSGELLIGGDGVACGYLNRPELTAEKFIANPFGEGRVYRTGDLAKWRPDGTIECLGRLDHQVKLRGFRIELGEIEATLAKAEGVRQAVVVLREEELVAYVVSSQDPSPTSVALREHLRGRLPEYMVPARYVMLDKLPLTPNGKIDRKALPSPEGDTVVATAAYEAPRTDAETKLAAIWEQVLKRAPIGIHDNFFDLGGHSLLAVRLFAEIEKHFGQKLPLATLFSHATIAGLAPALEVVGAASPAAWSSLIPIQPGGARAPLFCIHGAGGNVLLYRDLATRLGPDQPVYGFQSRGLDGRSQPLETIEEMAQAYLAELRAVRPKGPYCLAGYCLGGMVAYQMARLLRSQGEVVALVALLDTYNPAEAGESSRIGIMLQRARFHVSNLVQAGPRHLGSYLREKLRVARDGELANMLGLKRHSSNGHGQNRGYPGEDPGGHSGVQRVNDQAVGLFQPEPYDGSVVIFKPQVNYASMADPLLGWGGLVRGGVQVVELPVNPHAMLVEPFVRELARELQRRLNAIS